MAFRTMCVALLLSVLPIAGCGTVANLVRPGPEAGGKTPFGGVRQDVWCIQKAADGEFVMRTHPKTESEQYARGALVLLCAADLPLSFIGDVVTWPYTVAYSFINQPTPVPPIVLAPDNPRLQASPPPGPEPLTPPEKLP